MQITILLRFTIDVVQNIIRNCMKEKFWNPIFLVVLIIGCTHSIDAQQWHRFSLSVTAGMSRTGSLEYSEEYREFDVTPTIDILTTTTSRNRNYNFTIGFQPAKSISINGSIGVASYGFQYSGLVIASPTNFASVGGFITTEKYSTRLMEVGLSTSYRKSINEDLSIIIRPGLMWYTNPKENFAQLLDMLMNSNNFSATFFAGLETPLVNNRFYISLGLNTKIALQNFANDKRFNNKFLPYALGLQTSISYRFWETKSKYNKTLGLK